MSDFKMYGETKFNSVAVLGEKLAECGVEHVVVTWSAFIDNEYDGARLFVSPKFYSRFSALLDDMKRDQKLETL